MVIYGLALSKKYDCMYSLDELAKYNNGKCLIDPNYRKHKSDDCFGQFMLLFKSPKGDGNYIEIGIAEDGFVYAGDAYIHDYSQYKEADIKFAMTFMLKYKNMVNAIRDFEYDLGRIVKNNEYVNIIYDNNYHKENSQKPDFEIK